MPSRSCKGAFAILAALLSMRAAIAADECQSNTEDCVAVGSWNFSIALGGGVRTNPLANSASIPLVVIPHVSYYGKRFFLDDLDVGFTLGEVGENTFNLVASPGYDRVYFFRSDLQNFFVNGFPTNADVGAPGGPRGGSQAVSTTAVRFPSRTPRVTYLAGPEWIFAHDGFSAQVDLLHEITEQNRGNEVRAAIGVPLYRAHGLVSANLGITWNSAAIVNYYYGAANVYKGGSALDPFIKIGYAMPLGGHWRFDSFAEYERLAGAIADSPIVNQNHVTTVFAGVVYGF
jgi:outer membrane protein